MTPFNVTAKGKDLRRPKNFRLLIETEKIELPEDIKLDDMFIFSSIEPDFLDKLKIKYPEYFV